MKFDVHFYSLLGFDVTIEASSEEEAKQKAEVMLSAGDVFDDMDCCDSGFEVIGEVA